MNPSKKVLLKMFLDKKPCWAVVLAKIYAALQTQSNTAVASFVVQNFRLNHKLIVHAAICTASSICSLLFALTVNNFLVLTKMNLFSFCRVKAHTSRCLFVKPFNN